MQPPFADPADYVVLALLLVCGLLTTGTITAVGRIRMSGNIRRRVDRARLGTGPASGNQPKTTAANVRRRRTGTIFGQYGGSLLRHVPSLTGLRHRLDCARIPIHAIDFMLLCGLSALASSALFYLVMDLPLHFCIALFFMLATIGPKLLIGYLKNRRQKDFVRCFPDAIDLVVRGVRSGLPVSETILTAGQEMKGAVSEVFQSIYGSIKLGKTLDEALALAEHSIDVQELKFFRISLSIQQETGGNLGEILNNLSYLMRRREQLKLKIKAMASEARASALIIGSLPFIVFLVLYVVDPHYVRPLIIDPRGHLIVGIGLCSLATGIGIMVKMVRFRI